MGVGMLAKTTIFIKQYKTFTNYTWLERELRVKSYYILFRAVSKLLKSKNPIYCKGPINYALVKS